MTFEELCERYKSQDSFMEPQITPFCAWSFVVDIETNKGGWCFADERFIDGGVIWGYGARLSAPGYLDCTDWAVFDTEDEAVEYLAEEYLNWEDDDGE